MCAVYVGVSLWRTAPASVELYGHVLLIRMHPKKAKQRLLCSFRFRIFMCGCECQSISLCDISQNIFHPMHLILHPTEPNRMLTLISVFFIFFIAIYKIPDWYAAPSSHSLTWASSVSVSSAADHLHCFPEWSSADQRSKDCEWWPVLLCRHLYGGWSHQVSALILLLAAYSHIK